MARATTRTFVNPIQSWKPGQHCVLPHTARRILCLDSSLDQRVSVQLLGGRTGPAGKGLDSANRSVPSKVRSWGSTVSSPTQQAGLLHV